MAEFVQLCIMEVIFV